MWVRKPEAAKDVRRLADWERDLFEPQHSCSLSCSLPSGGTSPSLPQPPSRAQYRSPFVVFASSTLALWAVAAIAVYVGQRRRAGSMRT